MWGPSLARWTAIGLTAAAAFAAGPAALPAPQPAKPEKTRELVIEVCTYCHEIERVTEQHLTASQWRGLIKGMIDEGPPVTPAEFSRIVDYLAKNFGPPLPGKESQ